MISLLQREMTLLLIIICETTRIDSEQSISLIFGGDVTLGGIVRHFVRTGRCSYNDSFQKIKPHLQAGDFVVVNLETVLQESRDDSELYPSNNIHFIADPQSIEVLQYVGVTAVTLANNHITDLGLKGLQTTTKILDQYDIRYIGLTYGEGLDALQKPLILEKDGIMVGLLAYCRLADCRSAHIKVGAGAAAWSVPKAVKEINGLRKAGCHVVVLFMHWDNSYTTAMASRYMRDIKRIVKRASPDLIVGAHPHTTHPHFYMRNTLIASSLGNLLFPSHYASISPFSEEDDEEKNIKDYEDIWYKQSTSMPNPTSVGKLLRLEVNRNGIVRNGTWYLPIEIAPSFDGHCLVVEKKKRTEWITVCGVDDTDCVGTNDCNILECNGMDPNPVLS